MKKKSKKKNNKKVIILTIIIIVIITVVIGIIVCVKHKNDEIESYGVEHRDASKLNLETMKAQNNLEVDMEYYEEAFGNIKDGAYFYAKLFFKNKTIVIEESIINIKRSSSINGPNVQSMLYSEQKLNDYHIYIYMNQMHSTSCGVEIKKIKNTQPNYYYVKYNVPEEC